MGKDQSYWKLIAIVICMPIAEVRSPVTKLACILQSEDHPCRPIQDVQGTLTRTVPKNMHSVPFPLEGISKHFVCQLSESSTSSGTTLETTAEPTFMTSDGPLASTNNPITSATGSLFKIFVTDTMTKGVYSADLQDPLEFVLISSSGLPTDLAYDLIARMIYWADDEDNRLYRTSVDGSMVETVYHDHSTGLAIAEISRVVYFSNSEYRILSVSIRGNVLGDVKQFLDYGKIVKTLEVDERHGYLYWTTTGGVSRTFLNGSGSVEEVYRENGLTQLSGLSIDLTRNVPRIFFVDYTANKAYSKDVNGKITDVESAVELTDYISQSGCKDSIRDISFFKGNLYWVRQNVPSCIGAVMGYDHTNRSYMNLNIIPTKNIYQMHITEVAKSV